MPAEPWHLVEAQRDDGHSVMFRIRELVPQLDLRTIFVVELPFETTEMSRLPSAVAYRRLRQFEDEWLAPTVEALGLAWVGVRIEDGSSFFYLYGNGDPNAVIARLSPFDAAIGFYDDADARWAEYGTLRELLDAAKQKPSEPEPVPVPEPTTRRRRRSSSVTQAPQSESQTAVVAMPTTRIRVTKSSKSKKKPRPRR
jgi:hypothetical protein